MTATPHEDPAEQSGCLRFYYRNWRPTRLGKISNRAWALVTGLGLTPKILLTLQVKGRSSGRLCSTVLVVANHQGQRYLASMLGEGSEWVRNVRAAGGEAFIKRGRSRPVKLIEIAPKERAPILQAWCKVATAVAKTLRYRPSKQSQHTTQFFASTQQRRYTPGVTLWVNRETFTMSESFRPLPIADETYT